MIIVHFDLKLGQLSIILINNNGARNILAPRKRDFMQLFIDCKDCLKSQCNFFGTILSSSLSSQNFKQW